MQSVITTEAWAVAEQTDSALVIRVRLAIAAVLGTSGLATGLTHVHDVAADYGQEGWRAWAAAVTVELVVLHMGLVVLARLRARPKRPVGAPATIGAAFFVLSLACQVHEGDPNVWGWLMAAQPVLAFLLVAKVELGELMHQPAQEEDTERTREVDTETGHDQDDVPSDVHSRVRSHVPSERRLRSVPPLPRRFVLPAADLADLAARRTTQKKLAEKHRVSTKTIKRALPGAPQEQTQEQATG